MSSKKNKKKKSIQRAVHKPHLSEASDLRGLKLESYAPSRRGFMARTRVIGVGGGGGNAVSRMMQGDRIRGVEFVAVNTDAQDLDYATAHKKIYIGKALTKGLGAGMNPEIGKQAAEENRSEIGEVLEGSDIIFLTAGMGGGTGSGALPVVADIAREKGILTIAIVTKPFSFEGSQRMAIAQDALMRLKDKVDALVVIPNDRIFSLISKETPIMRAFGFVDDVLKNAVEAIAELINSAGIINVDFADIKAILKDSGATMIGIGLASGTDRSVKAVTMALNSPLLEITIDGAKGVLFSVAGGRDLKMAEIHDIAKAVSANLDPNARVIFGAYHDRGLKDKALRVTVIATGFSGMLNQRMTTPTLFNIPEESPRPEQQNSSGGESRREKAKPRSEEGEKEPRSGGKADHLKPEKHDSWEIPAFLRKKRR